MAYTAKKRLSIQASCSRPILVCFFLRPHTKAQATKPSISGNTREPWHATCLLNSGKQTQRRQKGLDHLANQLKRPAFSWKANALIEQYHPLARMGRLLRGLAQVRRVALSRNLLIPDPDLCSLCSAHQSHYNRGILFLGGFREGYQSIARAYGTRDFVFKFKRA